jgi:LysR family nitrogen assimilation transcriptional regulator
VAIAFAAVNTRRLGGLIVWPRLRRIESYFEATCYVDREWQAMDLKQLEYFVHVAELRSFTKAAALLSVAQPALSRQVRHLEVELRQTLLYRNGRGVIPTDAGKRLLAHGRGILLQVERAKQELEEMRGTPVGHVVIGAPPTIMRLFAPPLVSAFQSRFPKATLRIVEARSRCILSSRS